MTFLTFFKLGPLRLVNNAAKVHPMLEKYIKMAIIVRNASLQCIVRSEQICHTTELVMVGIGTAKNKKLKQGTYWPLLYKTDKSLKCVSMFDNSRWESGSSV